MIHTLNFRVYVKSKKIMGVLEGFKDSKVYIQDMKNPFLIKDCYIMQYIGKHDTEGNKIYQHDVIRTKDDETVVVLWSPTSCAFEGRGREHDHTYTLAALEFDEVELLGNIHQNQEFYPLYMDILMS